MSYGEDIVIDDQWEKQYQNGQAVPVLVSLDWHVESGQRIICKHKGKRAQARVSRVEQAGSKTKIWLTRVH